MKTLDNQAFYDHDAQQYDQRWASAGGSTTEQTQQAIVADLCADWAGRNVVEIGCGTGRFSLILARMGIQLTLIDLSPRMLAVAQAKLVEQGLAHNVQEYLNASIYDLPITSATVGGIVSLNVFNHLNNVALALRQCARILKPGGELLFNYPNLYSYFWPVAWRINQRHQAIGQEVFSQWFKPAEVNRHLQAAGFVLTKRVGHVHAPRALDRFGLHPLLQGLDRLSRQRPLQGLAPVHFCLCQKVEDHV